jgi:hypothetical protein
VVRLSGLEQRVTATAGALRSLEDALLPEGKVVRTSDDGVEWLTLRGAGLVVRASLRVNREKKLGQLLLSLQKVEGDDELLPRDVVVERQGKPCHCLTASEVLERLYGSSGAAPLAGNGRFAVVAEREDYLTLGNYRRLEARRLVAKPKRSDAGEPRLAGFAGVPYPGPPILGDARALAAFLLRKEKLGPRDGERTAWLFFDLAPMSSGESIRVSIDIGRSPIVFEFKITRE